MAKTKFGKWFERNFNIGHALRDLEDGNMNDHKFIAALGAYLAKPLENAIKEYSGSGMTDAQKEAAELDLTNQQVLNQQEYDRKVEFYQNFESFEAQVRQQKAAGLNPALMFGGAPSASASGGIGTPGSSDVASPSGGDVFGTILSGILGFKRFGLEQKSVKAEIRARNASTVAQEIENRYKERLNDLEIAKREKDLQKTDTEIFINMQSLKKLVAETDFAEIYATFAPDLFQNQIDLGASERSLQAAQARLADSNASLNEERKKEISSIIVKNEKEKQLIDSNISKIREELALIASQTDLNSQAVEESKQRVKNMQEEIILTGKKIGLTQKDIDWYANNHTEVVNVNNEGPVQTVTFKDNKGAYTVAADGKVIYNRPYQPNVNSKGKRN